MIDIKQGGTRLKLRSPLDCRHDVVGHEGIEEVLSDPEKLQELLPRHAGTRFGGAGKLLQRRDDDSVRFGLGVQRGEASLSGGSRKATTGVFRGESAVGAVSPCGKGAVRCRRGACVISPYQNHSPSRP